MTTEALKKLRKLNSESECEEKAAVIGKRCAEFKSCKDCMGARDKAATKLIDEVEKSLVPEGMEWPRFEDGEKVRIGDEIALKERTATVDSVQIHRPWAFSLWYDGGFASATYYNSAPVKRPDPGDTQERIDADAEKYSCEYFGFDGRLCHSNGGCPAREMGGSCELVKIKDLLRRQRELDARKDGAR